MKVDKQIVFSKQDMGRRSARSGASRITKYINYRSPSEEGDTASIGRRSSSRSRRSRSDEKVNLYSGRSVTLLGMDFYRGGDYVSHICLSFRAILRRK